MGLDVSAKIVNVFLFVVTIIVICATFIPTLYEIEDNTSQLEGEGAFVYWEEQLHKDLLVMIAQLDLFNSLLESIDTNLESMDDNLNTLAHPTLVREVQEKVEKIAKVVDQLKAKVAMSGKARGIVGSAPKLAAMVQ